MASAARRAGSATSEKHRAIEDAEVKPYVITADLGKGSFATVYKGYHEESNLQVAIKTVKRDALTAKLFDNLQSEITILKSLSHPHITKLLDIVMAKENIYLIIEFCAGGDLTNYIKKRGRVEGLAYVPSPGAAVQYYQHPRTGGLDEIVVRSFLRQLARALKFLRPRNLIHRDIKPQNLLLNPPSARDLARGHPIGVPILKVADFGFARALPNAMMAETLCGSPLYMAPEILRYEKYDAKADLWSVGAVLHEMAVGKPPFRAQNHMELLKRIDQSSGIKFPDEDPKSTSEAAPVPSDVKQLIRALLKRNPVERATYKQFFDSPALANSKFPRPTRAPSPDVGVAEEVGRDGRPSVPAHHRVIPPEVLDATAMIPPSRFNFRQPSNGEQEWSSSPRPPPPETPVRQSAGARKRSPKAVATDASYIPGETEEDGMLRREYVLVDDNRAVEFNRVVDDISAARQRPLHDRRTPSTAMMDDYRPPPPDSPSTGVVATTFPPPPNTAIPPPPPLSSSPSTLASRAASNAINRALSIASKKLFGTHGRQSSQEHSARRSHDSGSDFGAGGSPSNNVNYPSSSSSSSPRNRVAILSGEGEIESDGERDPLEEALLASLEQLAQKTHVVTNWADEMYEFVKALPQKPLPDPSKFAARQDEAEKQAQKRKDADAAAEYNAVTCVALYMLLMSFSQKGIAKLKDHQEHMSMRHPEGNFLASEGFDRALLWFKDHFLKCNERAALVKTWLPAQYDGPKTWLDQLVYDRALRLSRVAARKELFNQASSPTECEKLYEESLWCLYALQDDLLQTGNPYMEEDRTTIATWIKRTKLRLVRCRARMPMSERERLNDVRADNNLVDVARVPAPWDEVQEADAGGGDTQQPQQQQTERGRP